MMQRIKLAFKILFCKSYFISDGNTYSIYNMNTTQANGLIKVLSDLSEDAINQEIVLQEVKEILNSH
jgi:hypothetical protein